MNNGDMPASPVYNNDGYPSVGRTVLDNNEAQCTGLTKREELAARAMQGMLSSPHCSTDINEVTRGSVICADALLAELEKDQ